MTKPAAAKAVLLFTMVAAACGGGQAPSGPALDGFSSAAGAQQLQVEERLASALDAASVDAFYREATRLPHPSGSERTRELAEWITERFREYGFDEVRLNRYDVLLPLPTEVSVQMTAPIDYTPALREDAYDVDPDTAQDPGITYLGMSASGDVSGELIYAHSGNPEDYDWLIEQGIDPAGKIAIVRYSLPYSYRGFKALEAERRGVKALLIYSDPKEDGFTKGAVFPDGPWGPESHIQRGAITYDFIVPGDPLTPGWASIDGAERVPVQEARSVPKIIAVPMSYRDAQPLLENIGGPEVPESWVGALPITYRAGGDGAVVRVNVQMDDQVRPIWVPEGRILGSELPDELVVLGNHHDAWVFGGVDPSSGTATMLELARVLGAMAQAGQRPRRTLVFGSWDAEEWHLTGSTEWGEHYGEELGRNAIAYLNVDSSVSGSQFDAAAVASLNRLIVQTARDVIDPESGTSLLEAWRADVAGDADIDRVANELGSGSDYTVFLNYLGVPVANLSFDGPYGVYHSIYDDYWRMTNLVDPGLRYMTVMAEVWGRMALRLANAELLPFDFETYESRVRGFVDGLRAIDGAGDNLDLASVYRALDLWKSRSAELRVRVDAWLQVEADPAVLRQVNEALRLAERRFLLQDGIPGRPWFRHALYAPRYTYAAMSLPGITEAAEAGDWELAAAEVRRLEQAIAAFTGVLEEALAAPR